LGSLGGGGLIILGFSSFLAKVWLDRITKQNSFLVDKNLEAFKNQHIKDLEVLKSQYNSQLEVLKQKNIEIQIDKNNFHQISNAFYQSFFEERVKVYLELLKIKYRYFSEMEESIMTDFHDAHSTVAFSTYKEIRELINQKQFYISNDLDNLFAKLRSQASSHLKSEEMVKAQNFSNENEDYENRYAEYEKVYYDFFKENYKLLEVMFIQIEKDIADLRKRVDF
jgi:hypothetical protein